MRGVTAAGMIRARLQRRIVRDFPAERAVTLPCGIDVRPRRQQDHGGAHAGRTVARIATPWLRSHRSHSSIDRTSVQAISFASNRSRIRSCGSVRELRPALSSIPNARRSSSRIRSGTPARTPCPLSFAASRLSRVPPFGTANRIACGGNARRRNFTSEACNSASGCRRRTPRTAPTGRHRSRAAPFATGACSGRSRAP